MNRPFLFLSLGLLVFSLPPALDAEAVNCVPDRGCPKGQKAPKCCQQPKCAFWEEYLAAQAKADIISRMTGEGGEFELAPLVHSLADLIRFRERVGEEIRKWQKTAPRCPKSERLGEPPIFSVMPADECRIMTNVGMGNFAELNLDDVLSKSDTCEEIVNARYSAAKARSEGGTCFLEQNFRKDYLERQQEFVNETEREARELENDLARWWRACTTTEFSVEKAKDVAERAIKALSGKGPKGHPPKAKRSRKQKRHG